MDSSKPIINFAGSKVGLGPLQKEHIYLYYQWNNDFTINRTTASMRPLTLEEQNDAYDQFIRNKQYVFFTIYELETFKPIGLTYLADIQDRNAEFGIVIGEVNYHGKGYGTETTQLMLDYAFTILGLHNVMLSVYAFNQAGIAAYQKAGFKEYGRRREVKYRNGKLHDQVFMDCISTEFNSVILSELCSQKSCR
ncbi:hypothetical protein BVG16_27160 [Paenibacillus selenitireducens]|uniref:N-acetyltransferase domain-containing protein n=1 Tax=Paenibacillus selenitireducens TaxID=1324314 RepID=A0A1T2X1R8_9BACL|nr:GNAT family protein [Paenibacillus selenitireducens]OPA73765.1 hypothetical protein BVG16_27160 [Paenibacillus selenitireducens]